MTIFDLRDVKPAGQYSPIPSGEYMAIVKSAEVKDTKAGDGQYIKTQMEVIGGEHDGRKFWANFNVKNKNPEAVRIAMSDLKSMMLASGLPEDKCVIKDVGDLCGLTFGVKLKVEDDQNRVAAYLPLAPGKASEMAKDSKSNPFAGW